MKRGQKKSATFDLTDITGFANWDSAYSKRTIEYDVAKVVFSAANKQSSNITDCPVTKGQPIEVILKQSNAKMTAITVTLKQWTNKKQTATLHYSTDGGTNYTKTTITSSTFVLSSTELPTGTNAVKVTFSSTSNQVGCSGIEITYVE